MAQRIDQWLKFSAQYHTTERAFSLRCEWHPQSSNSHRLICLFCTLAEGQRRGSRRGEAAGGCASAVLSDTRLTTTRSAAFFLGECATAADEPSSNYNRSGCACRFAYEDVAGVDVRILDMMGKWGQE